VRWTIVTDGQTSARITRADGARAPMVRLPWGVCAVAHGDWLIFLDLARNRYQAMALTEAPELVACAVNQAVLIAEESRRHALLREGLVAVATREDQPVPGRHVDQVSWRDLLLAVAASMWARGIVKRGALLEAFHHLSERKARLGKRPPDFPTARLNHSRFAAARIWIPAAYVCLFDSLALMRFLLARGVRADLVFGVRSRPFAAHCWVEVDGVILDDGGEACHSFAEITRA
jgi:hypothetical protein